MNDFREYAAAFADHQDDLCHYGTKGMKWRHHKRVPISLVGPNTKSSLNTSQSRSGSSNNRKPNPLWSINRFQGSSSSSSSSSSTSDREAKKDTNRKSAEDDKEKRRRRAALERAIKNRKAK